jgi:hypothetical protein
MSKDGDPKSEKTHYGLDLVEGAKILRTLIFLVNLDVASSLLSFFVWC